MTHSSPLGWLAHLALGLSVGLATALAPLMTDPTVRAALAAIAGAIGSLVVVLAQYAQRRIMRATIELDAQAKTSVARPSTPPAGKAGFVELQTFAWLCLGLLALCLAVLSTESCTAQETAAAANTIRAVIDVANGTCLVESAVAPLAGAALDAGLPKP